jgi:hypothetical protein
VTGNGWERAVYLDERFSGGGGFNRPSCRACKQPIEHGTRSIRVEFNNDPNGAKGLTGEYHIACSKPFASMARIINMNPWAR